MRAKVIAMLGCSVFEFGVAHLAIAFPYRNLASRLLETIEGQVSGHEAIETQTNRQARLMSRVVNDISSVDGLLNPGWQDIRTAAPSEVPDEVLRNVMSKSARDIGVLRDLRTKPGFDSGVEGWRLSPLGRFPIVRLDSGDDTRYAIPNLRTYFRAFPEIVHFTLLEALGDRFNEFRGAAQEVYLRLMLRDQRPSLVVIPEQSYRRGKDLVRGPDVTVIDAESRALIVVESKARRTLAETRFTMDEEAFDRNFEDVYEALRKLPQKIDDIRNFVGPYSQWATEIGSVAGGATICVCVVGEAVYFMTELMRFRAAREPDHALALYPHPYCVMSLETFEIAVAISREETVPLARVLFDFWEASEFQNPSRATAEHFEGRNLGALTLFGERFAREAEE